jgi:hypothetical protein
MTIGEGVYRGSKNACGGVMRIDSDLRPTFIHGRIWGAIVF